MIFWIQMERILYYFFYRSKQEKNWAQFRGIISIESKKEKRTNYFLKLSKWK